MKPIGMGMAMTTKGVYGGLRFIAEQANSTVALTKKGSPPNIPFETSTDGENWSAYKIGTVITLANVGDYVYFRRMGKGKSNSLTAGSYSYHLFVMTGLISARGDITSLLNQAMEDIALGTLCYYLLFDTCKSLLTAPELPATKLGEECYYSMFVRCSSLINAPVLPATTLKNQCYTNMFAHCNSLRSINVNFTSWGDGNDTSSWVLSYIGMPSDGRFYKPSALDVKFGVNYIPAGWTVVNKD